MHKKFIFALLLIFCSSSCLRFRKKRQQYNKRYGDKIKNKLYLKYEFHDEKHLLIQIVKVLLQDVEEYF